MKKMLIPVFILFGASCYSQNLDLVVTTSGDSIACKIDSITESAIYLQIKTSGNVNWIQTIYDKKNIQLFTYGSIDPSKYAFKEGTSKIIGSVQPVYAKKFPNKMTLNNASNEDLEFYLAKARKTKKKGMKMSIAGPLAATAGGLLAASSFTLSGDDAGFVFGSLLFFAGIGTTLVGIPILITGSSRVNNINEIKKSRRLTLKVIPDGHYNYETQNYQAGITLKIGF